MNQKKVLIVGGAGYIGSHVNKLLASQGIETIIVDNLEYGHREFVKWGTLIEGDIRDISFLHKIFSDFDICAVMHFSAYAYVGESVKAPIKYYDNNVAGTINLLKAMQQAAVKKFIFSSSCATFGIPHYLPIDEKHPQNPINPYGRTKLMIEQILQDLPNAWGLKYVCLRYFNAAGADPDGEIGEWHEPETHLIPLVIQAALNPENHKITIYGTDWDTPDGTCIRDYIHVNDLAQAHFAALSFLDKNPSIYLNLGNGTGYSIKDIIKTVEDVSERKVPVIYGSRRAGDPAALVGNSALAKQILEWDPKFTSLRSIIETAWNWHKEQTTLNTYTNKTKC
jgi:UDP-glucose 4-epimerase